MLVLDPENDEPLMKFDVDPGLYKETRTIEYVLGEDGLLEGDLNCRFESFPLSQDLDPWDSSTDLAPLVSRALPANIKVRDPHWKEVNWTTMRCTKETPAVLACRVEHEALPAGETGWEIRPFYLPLPRLLNEVLEEQRKGPLLLTEGTEIHDAVFLRLDGRSVVSIPDPVEKKNRLGQFYSAWEVRENGIFATRKLLLAPNTLSPREVRLARQLHQAWKNAGKQSVVIE
jgi:hypothetical protein